jgi:hypothetical protein
MVHTLPQPLLLQAASAHGYHQSEGNLGTLWKCPMEQGGEDSMDRHVSEISH